MAPRHIGLMDLPTEILHVIANYFDRRLGLPNGILTRHIVEIFRTPTGIAVRAIAHYKSPNKAFVLECSRSESGQQMVVGEIFNRMSGRDGFDLNETTAFVREPGRVVALEAAAHAKNLDVVRYLLELALPLKVPES
ncbi:hypothetical protein HDU93_008681 [Gonapodya sp. JEL0774]|nr:hypothetical protein HDU93_008681 [Gonapodya sp. JEL0774]